MNIYRLVHLGISACVFASALFLPGCLPTPAPVPPEEAPMPTPPALHRPGEPGQSGRQDASAQLTEQGRRQLAAGRIQEAVSLFQKAISLQPKNPYPYYYLGRARYQLGEYSQALAPLGQAELYLARDESWRARIHALRGLIYEARIDYAQARTQYEKALGLDPENAEAREGMDRIRQLNPAEE